ncbi:2OG-Fe(II) oxygenase [Coniochaeta ligniaria NRRL 30616]|uniref:2OG-Fe(II) oxygenase n=1 Tax=Coniochaeta ligniaria NRRL 30616 TaxID=1408157 RepID=A0A1J7J8N1_9PEZI|nr:2OG-Fe(II) oxygenase [Coniochaeta ligniaria NRRL 30616]
MPGHKLLQLTSPYGPVFRSIKTTPPRDATVEEIPIIDVGGIFSDSLADRQAVAAEIRRAATTSGFFYMKNHGVPEETIQTCLSSAKEFFHQPDEIKRRVSLSGSKWFNGWNGPGSHRANAVESIDHRESFGMRYDPRYDPSVADPAAIPQAIRDGFRAEEYVWEQTANLPEFKTGVLGYWRACLALARQLVRVFALALDLPEDYFDAMTSHPDAAIALNYYPTIPASALAEGAEEAVSIGSHTDLQFFTMLWQDRNGGLQVLTREGQWLNAMPVEGTFVVNIGDYLQRITNDRFISTVHRAKNFKTVERFSMPFFFGFNFNETCGVLPSCIDEEHPAKYEPISCEEWVRLRFKATNMESKDDE